MHPRILALACSLPLVAAGAARGGAAPGADMGLPGYRAPAGLAGSLTIVRTVPTDALVETWMRTFHALNPAAAVRQTEKSTDLPAASFAELVAGRAGLAPFVREAQPAELEEARRKLGFEPLGIAVASGSYATPSNTHAIALYVHADNPLERMTLAQMDAIYSSTRRRGYPEDIVSWGQLGLTGAWADRPIHFYGMVVNRKVGNPHSGIVSYLMDRVMLGGEFKPGTRQVPDTGMGRGNNRALDEIVEAVAADQDGIGYAGFANAKPGARTLALAENVGGPFYAGTRDEVASRAYPLTRTIYLFVLKRPGQPLDPVAREFLLFVLSREGQQAVADDPSHFLPLPAGFAAGERAKLR